MNLNYWSGGSPVSMGEILDARESRAAIQKEMLKRNPGCLVCLTLNIPGPVKTFPFVRWLYEVGKGRLLETAELLSPSCKQAADQKLPGCMQEFREVKEYTGYECFASMDLDPQAVKAALTHFEETHPVGRLFDFDVLRPDGTKVSRQELGYPQRTCLLCGSPAFLCGRSRRHSARELLERELFLMESFFTERMSVHLGLLMQKALLYEVNTFLKPGLVDHVHNGAHQDMCAVTFVKSAYALTPYFTDSARLGLTWKGNPDDLPGLFAALRRRGIQAEAEMFSATGGVNTHKGVIFSGGILCCALGCLLSRENLLTSKGTLEDFSRLPAMVKSLLADQWANPLPAAAAPASKASCTHGEALYLSHGIGGIRREAAAGFPSVFHKGFPLFVSCLKQDFSLNQAGCLTLLSYISFLEDTNLYTRAGYEKGRDIQRQLTTFLSSRGPKEQLQILPELDAYFTEHHISPGGSADMLALTYFLYFLSEKPCCFF